MALPSDHPLPYDPVPWFTEKLEAFAQRLASGQAQCRLGGIRPAPDRHRPSGPTPRVLPWSRFDLGLSGGRPTIVSRGGHAESFVLRANDVCYWAPEAWAREGVQEACAYIGVVFRARYLRLIAVDHPGGNRGEPTSVLHTARPLSGAARGVLQALDERAEEPSGQLEIDNALASAVLRLARQHLLDDPVRHPRGAAATWEQVRDFLAEHANQTSLGREDVAKALGITAGYLSELCRHSSGRSFSQYLEEQRFTRARRLLRARVDLTIAQIAVLCGFSSAGYFGRAFKRATGVSPGEFRQSRKL